MFSTLFGTYFSCKCTLNYRLKFLSIWTTLKVCRLVMGRVPRGSVVKCLTRNPGVLGSSRTGSSGFFSWECPWARHFRAQPSTGETQESMNNVSCRRDMTEILLKAA